MGPNFLINKTPSAPIEISVFESVYNPKNLLNKVISPRLLNNYDSAH